MTSALPHQTARISACLAIALGVLLLGSTPDSGAATVSATLTNLQTSGQLDPAKAVAARSTYHAARSLRKRASAVRRLPLTNQLRTIESLAKKNRLTADRVTPLFTQLRVNVDWFSANGPGVVGARARLGGGRIYYQYFAGWGWQFHPLANFSRLNAIWNDKSAAARRSLGKYAYELATFGVNRGGALTWEYYFPFSGSRAPFISSISQGTAVQALARSGNALKDPAITTMAAQAARSFDVNAPTGLKVELDGGLHFLGYSGSPKLIIFNMFAQALDGLHDYAKITGDAAAQSLFERGLVAARVELPQSDTGAWSYYSLGGAESNLNYHQVLIEFLTRLCEDTDQEALFCDLRARLSGYLTTAPKITGVTKRIKRGRIYLTFTLSKVSTVTVTTPGGGRAVATVGRGKRVFSVKKARSKAVTILVKDLAGNTASRSK